MEFNNDPDMIDSGEFDDAGDDFECMC